MKELKRTQEELIKTGIEALIEQSEILRNMTETQKIMINIQKEQLLASEKQIQQDKEIIKELSARIENMQKYSGM